METATKQINKKKVIVSQVAIMKRLEEEVATARANLAEIDYRETPEAYDKATDQLLRAERRHSDYAWLCREASQINRRRRPQRCRA